MAVAAWLCDAVLRLVGSKALAASLFEEMGSAMGAFADRITDLRFTVAFSELFMGAIGAPLRVFGERPLAAGLLALFVAPAWMVGGGAICRMVTVDVARNLNLPIAEAVAYAMRRWASLAGAALIPLALMGLIGALIRLAGWALLSVSVIDVLGGVAYGLMLVGGVALWAMIVGYAAATPLLAPAVMVEDGDAMDAVQRGYAYIVGRPGRAAIYGGVALIEGAVAAVLARMFLATVIFSTAALATAWVGPGRAKALLLEAKGQPLAGWLIGQWHHLAWLIFAAFAVSLYFTASTLVYLLLRRVNDEQDIRDVWMEREKDAAGN